jgi:ClpP class serine protease
VNLDPKLLIAGLCLFAISLALAFILKLLRQRRLEEAIAPRPQAMAGLRFAADVDNGKPRPPGTKTIAIVHDFGHPYGHQTDERKYLSTREAFEILAEIRSVGKDTPIDVILHTPGGEVFACELIASALKDRANTTAYVPYCAMSAGTIIALATEKVVMGDHACLGPIDPQFFGFPIESFVRLLKESPFRTSTIPRCCWRIWRRRN